MNFFRTEVGFEIKKMPGGLSISRYKAKKVSKRAPLKKIPRRVKFAIRYRYIVFDNEVGEIKLKEKLGKVNFSGIEKVQKKTPIRK